MDFEKLLSATVRFSSFLGIRLIFFAVFAALLAPWTAAENLSSDLLKSIADTLQAISVEYKDLLMQIGLEGVTTYFLLFFTLVLIQLTFVLFKALGDGVPPSFRHTKLEVVEQNMIMRALEKCRRENLSHERYERILDAADELHKEVVESWNIQNSTAQELFSVCKGIALFSAVTAGFYFVADWKSPTLDWDIYYLFPICLITAAFASGIFLKNSRRGAHVELVRKLDGKLEAELFIAFASVDFKRRPTIASPNFDGEWEFRLSWLGSRS